MNTGKDINFLNKTAEDSTINSNATLTAVLPELPISDSKKADNIEKNAERSAKDIAMELSEKAGRPTSTGIVAGAGLGTILAALGALSRSTSDSDKHSIISNPALLGLVGASAGYLGGNALSSIKPESSKDKPSIVTPALISASGISGIGRALAKRDRDIDDAFIERRYRNLRRNIIQNYSGRRGTVNYDRIPESVLRPYEQAEREFKDLIERRGDTHLLERWGLGKPSSNKNILLSKIEKSTLNPINQLKSLSPLKTVRISMPNGTVLNLQQSIVDQLKNILGVSKFKGLDTLGKLRELGSIRRLPPRLAALTAIVGGGALGINALRRAFSKD